MDKQTPRTEPHNAPSDEPKVAEPIVEVAPQPTPPAPRPRKIERQGVRSEPYTRRLPQVRGGICEFCGVLDPNVPSQDQYKLCPHYRGIGEVRCTYCDESVDPTQVILHSVVNVAEHPDNPDTLIAWCNSYECSRKHEARFKRSR